MIRLCVAVTATTLTTFLFYWISVTVLVTARLEHDFLSVVLKSIGTGSFL